MAFKRTFTDRMPGRVEAGLQKSGIETVHGRARFTGPNTIEVNDNHYETRYVLIAAGARPRDVSVPGAGLMIDSTQFQQVIGSNVSTRGIITTHSAIGLIRHRRPPYNNRRGRGCIPVTWFTSQPGTGAN